MAQPRKYKVLKTHGLGDRFKKGDYRAMHPNLAKMLAERGLIEFDGKSDAPINEAPKGVKKTAKQVQSTTKSTGKVENKTEKAKKNDDDLPEDIKNALEENQD